MELHAQLAQVDVHCALVLLYALLANQIITWMVLANNVLLDNSYKEKLALHAIAFVPLVKLQPLIAYHANPNIS